MNLLAHKSTAVFCSTASQRWRCTPFRQLCSSNSSKPFALPLRQGCAAQASSGDNDTSFEQQLAAELAARQAAAAKAAEQAAASSFDGQALLALIR